MRINTRAMMQDPRIPHLGSPNGVVGALDQGAAAMEHHLRMAGAAQGDPRARAIDTHRRLTQQGYDPSIFAKAAYKMDLVGRQVPQAATQLNTNAPAVRQQMIAVEAGVSPQDLANYIATQAAQCLTNNDFGMFLYLNEAIRCLGAAEGIRGVYENAVRPTLANRGAVPSVEGIAWVNSDMAVFALPEMSKALVQDIANGATLLRHASALVGPGDPAMVDAIRAEIRQPTGRLQARPSAADVVQAVFLEIEAAGVDLSTKHQAAHPHPSPNGNPKAQPRDPAAVRAHHDALSDTAEICLYAHQWVTGWVPPDLLRDAAAQMAGGQTNTGYGSAGYDPNAW